MQATYQCPICGHTITLIERWDSAHPEPDCERCDGAMRCLEERLTVAEEEERRRILEAWEKAKAQDAERLQALQLELEGLEADAKDG
jgi:hypothetical protein